PERPRH
ncbi:hypothetical protein CFC21_008058, partial [Triticum aestivum]